MTLVPQYMPQLLAGLGLTLAVAAASYLIGLVIALAMVLLWNASGSRTRAAIGAYVALVRGLPELLIIFLVFYGGTVLLTHVAGRYVEVSALTSGVAALGVVAGAYLTEILRSALQAVPKGQSEAAKSLGLPGTIAFRKIIFPQMLAFALPGLGNQWLVILKESALVSIVGLEELMRKSVVAAGATHAPLTFYLTAAAIYVGVTSVSTAVLGAVASQHTWRR
jgi:His/Glu/Gln/Arg/opine family amino acid ABC transporter permease subunit